MSMTKETLKKFVEEDYKDYTILVTCDNEHRFYHRSYALPDIIWNWDENTFTALEVHDDETDQNKFPMEVTTVSLDEIQFITAFIETKKALEFIQQYPDEKSKEKAKAILQKVKPGLMGPRTLRELGRDSRAQY